MFITDFEWEGTSKIIGERRHILLVNLDHRVQQRSYKILGMLNYFSIKNFFEGIVTDTTC